MDTVIYDTLKQKLDGAKVTIDGKETDLLSVVVDWEDGLTKTKATNANWKKDQETWQAKEKQLSEQLAALEKARNELTEQLKNANLSEDDKKRLEKLKTGNFLEKTEVEKQLNTVSEELKAMREKLEAADKEREQLKAANKKSTFDSELLKLKSDFVAELAQYKITGDPAEALWAMMLSKGSLKVIEGADGAIVRSVTAFKDGRPLSADLKSLCKQVASESPWAVSASGRTGTGQDHTGNGNGGNAGNWTGKENFTETRNRFREGLAKIA